MWYKVLLVIGIVVGVLIMVKTSGPGVQQMMQGEQDFLRSARNITLYEVNLESLTSTTIHAASAAQKQDNTIIFETLDLDHAGKLRMHAPHATYDMNTFQLVIEGDITLETSDGLKGFFRSLTWDRRSRLARTHNPVRVVTADGVIEAQGAEFLDDLSRISFIGGVHAQISHIPLDS
jgi:hypothetical protein